jgi:hypothetical protein
MKRARKAVPLFEERFFWPQECEFQQITRAVFFVSALDLHVVQLESGWPEAMRHYLAFFAKMRGPGSFKFPIPAASYVSPSGVAGME